MKRYCCETIDDYLDDDLSDAELTAFLRSVEQCSECRQIIEAQARIDADVKQAWQSIACQRL